MTTTRRTVQYNLNDPEATAREYRLASGREHSRARVLAQRAARDYLRAAEARRHAAWLTQRPDLWSQDSTPAGWESWAEVIERGANTWLRASFRETDQAHHSISLAQRYDAMARARAAVLTDDPEVEAAVAEATRQMAEG